MRSIPLLIFRLWAFIPRRVLQLMGSVLGTIHHFGNTRTARVTEINLELCGFDGNLRHQSLRETGKTLLETPAIWLGSKERIESWFGDVFGEPLLRDSVLANQGLLILLPHLGNWELFNVFYRRYGNMTALYHPPRLPYLDNIMQGIREWHGNEMVPTDLRGIRRLYRSLESSGTAVILPDQVPVSGRFAPFFGTAALTDELVIRLQKKTAARVLMLAFLRRSDGKFDIHITPAKNELYGDDSISALTALNSMVETSISLEPSQYQWEYKRFKKRPKGEKKVYRLNKPAGVHN